MPIGISVLCSPMLLMAGSWKAIASPRTSMNSCGGDEVVAGDEGDLAECAAWWSPPLELRCALLDEGAERFLAVVGWR